MWGTLRTGRPFSTVSSASEARKDPHHLEFTGRPVRARRCGRAMARRPAQPAGFSRAASVLISSNSLSSPPAIPTSVTYLPLMTTVGVLAMR